MRKLEITFAPNCQWIAELFHQSVVYDNQAVWTIASKISNFDIMKIKIGCHVLYMHDNEKLTRSHKTFDWDHCGPRVGHG